MHMLVNQSGQLLLNDNALLHVTQMSLKNLCIRLRNFHSSSIFCRHVPNWLWSPLKETIFKLKKVVTMTKCIKYLWQSELIWSWFFMIRISNDQVYQWSKKWCNWYWLFDFLNFFFKQWDSKFKITRFCIQKFIIELIFYVYIYMYTIFGMQPILKS